LFSESISSEVENDSMIISREIVRLLCYLSSNSIQWKTIIEEKLENSFNEFDVILKESIDTKIISDSIVQIISSLSILNGDFYNTQECICEKSKTSFPVNREPSDTGSYVLCYSYFDKDNSFLFPY
jgi:hypothetical protein